MQRHVDPCVDRSKPYDAEGHRGAEGATPEIDTLIDDDGTIELMAIVEDQTVGRREAPFSADPRRRARPVGE